MYCGKVKVNVDLYSASSWTHLQGAQYGTRSQGISQFYLHTPRSSAIGMNHTCLCLPSRTWYSLLIYRPQRDGRLSWPWVAGDYHGCDIQTDGQNIYSMSYTVWMQRVAHWLTRTVHVRGSGGAWEGWLPIGFITGLLMNWRLGWSVGSIVVVSTC